MAVLLILSPKKQQTLHNTKTIQADNYDQLSAQIMLTHHWLHMKKCGRDDNEIERAKKKVATARKKKNVFKTSAPRQVEEGVVSKMQQESEFPALTQTEVLEGCVDDTGSTSDDDEFESKLISSAKTTMYQNIVEIPHIKPRVVIQQIRTTQNTNSDSRLVKNLNKQIIKQSSVIWN